ncbi:hypothetical protein [uncultured Legionella sp.]|uniref:hypothetical protein n=1 Tax=uncultured Legionella sp. TaxID=210934 RepID=UPI00261E088F|nr:hypothetical protein [uncultured Legionella sp.]
MGRFFSKKTKKERAVLGYASLIKALLADAFINLNKSDFENPAGFSDKNKASSALNSYFGMRNQLEQLIKDECLLHRSLSTHDKTILQLRLDAIEHWLGVANQLLNDRCYDGWEIISTQLLLISRRLKTPNKC